MRPDALELRPMDGPHAQARGAVHGDELVATVAVQIGGDDAQDRRRAARSTTARVADSQMRRMGDDRPASTTALSCWPSPSKSATTRGVAAATRATKNNAHVSHTTRRTALTRYPTVAL
jgi:hypothetical protein